MADVRMVCAPGSYSAKKAEEVRDFYDRDGNVLTLVREEMTEMLTKDPGCIVPVQITPKDSVDQSIIDEIARRKLLGKSK